MRKVNQILTAGILSFLLGYFNNQLEGYGWVVFLLMLTGWLITFIEGLSE